jgi:hypothetical protein
MRGLETLKLIFNHLSDLYICTRPLYLYYETSLKPTFLCTSPSVRYENAMMMMMMMIVVIFRIKNNKSVYEISKLSPTVLKMDAGIPVSSWVYNHYYYTHSSLFRFSFPDCRSKQSRSRRQVHVAKFNNATIQSTVRPLAGNGAENAIRAESR